MIVKVTQEDIDKGVRNKVDRCPVARGIKRATGFKSCWVSCMTISVGCVYQVPSKSVANFIERFDAKKKVEPFSFRLKGTP